MSVEQANKLNPHTHDVVTGKPIVVEQLVSTYTVPKDSTASYFFGLIRKTFQLQLENGRLAEDGQMLPVHNPGATDGVWVRQNPQFERVAFLAADLLEKLGKLRFPVEEIYSVHYGRVNEATGPIVISVKHRFTHTTVMGRSIVEKTYALWEPADPMAV